MRALVLGASGAVGTAAAEQLQAAGAAVARSSRTAGPGVTHQINLHEADGWRTLASIAPSYDVIINASGAEDPRMATAVGATPLVEPSATARYFDALRRTATEKTTVLMGAGLAPGLTTSMIAALEPHRHDAVDLFIMLGTGEVHGPAAVEWTEKLAGRPLFAPPEGGQVRNLGAVKQLITAGHTRRYLRTDFPDHFLIGQPRGYDVRSYLAVTSRIGTAALALSGRVPALAGMISRAPHFGSPEWRVSAVLRRTGARLDAAGMGQSFATGLLTAEAALALVAQGSRGLITMDQVLPWERVRQSLAHAAPSRTPAQHGREPR